jgi:5-(carboxyamino)imidazole ribonucleotide synthase
VRGPLGILGGGQLARMTLQAASQLGIDVVIAERFARSPAARLTDRSIVFDNGWNDPNALDELARAVPIVTLENEFVDASVLSSLVDRGCTVLPGPECVATVQDKLLQKQALARAELPVPLFTDDPARAGDMLGWPVMLKARRDGYDGRGNLLARDQAEAEAGLRHLGRAVFAEAYVPFARELAVIVVRGMDGEVLAYPVVETRQDPQRHICRTVTAPADVDDAVARQAQAVARAAVEAVGGVGVFGIELFLLENNTVLINELAPRPHNSGHYTIEACLTSQFSNHTRAVLGLSLGAPTLKSRAAAMVNILGSESPGTPLLHAALAIPETYVHLYGKEPWPGRKLGHVTALAETAEQALEKASRAVELLGA